jgi:serine/threonine-protein kinase
MSPEQCAGTNVDHRTDIYAVGVMLYEMACGKVPFDADNLMGILTKHLYENPIAPSQLAPPVDVPPPLEAIILKCLQKKPEGRYQSMAELSADIDALEHGQTPRAVLDKLERVTSGPQTLTGVEARVSVATGQPDIAIRKRRAPLFIGLSVAAIALIGVAFAMSRSKEAPQAEAPKPTAPSNDPVAPPPAAAAQPTTPPPAAAEQPKPAAVQKVALKSSPDGAEVYVDGSLVGNTPFELTKPQGDDQLKVELHKPGYENKTFGISALSNDMTINLNKLEQRPAATPSRPAAATRPTKRPTRNEGTREERPRGQSQTEVLDPWN